MQTLLKFVLIALMVVSMGMFVMPAHVMMLLVMGLVVPSATACCCQRCDLATRDAVFFFFRDRSCGTLTHEGHAGRGADRHVLDAVLVREDL
jgi:hypothetical protein